MLEQETLWLPALDQRKLIERKEISPVELLDSSLARLDELEPKINAFLDVTRDQARENAKKVESAIVAGNPVGPLAGLPISVKDLIAVKGARLTFGSRAMENNVADIDAPAVERLRDAQASIIGKTTTSEFGCKGSGSSPLTGVTRNPWDLSKTPGGSSCGAAASIASAVTAFGLGTDGGGSIRIPSSFTGLFGIKGHFGRVPVFPTSATPTLAHVGPIARSVRDAALLLQVISGYDPRDPGAISQPVPDFLKECDFGARGMRLAWSPTLGYAKLKPEIREIVTDAVRALEDLGCHVEEVDQIFEDPIELFMAEFMAGAGTRLRPIIESDADILDPAVATMLKKALGQEMTDYYTKVFERYDLRTTMAEFFKKYDALITPTLPTEAFDAEADFPADIGSSDNILKWIAYTYPFNLTGLPAASIPAGFTKSGLPVGMQIVGEHLGEAKIFRIAAALEEARPWAHKRPPMFS